MKRRACVVEIFPYSPACNHVQSEEEGLKVKQEETAEAVQLAEQGGRPRNEAAGLVVPVQNGEGDSLNLSAGFIQVINLHHSTEHTCQHHMLGDKSSFA